MNAERRIYINNDLDVVVARMQAREMAKQMGFGTADQARISLAASELARVLSWNTRHSGEIIMCPAAKQGRHGLQIDCLISPDHLLSQSNSGQNNSLTGARQLVDESIIEVQANRHTRVTLLKWLK